MLCRTFCKSCKDYINKEDLLTTNGYCKECYEELTKGIIPNITNAFPLQSHASYLTKGLMAWDQNDDDEDEGT